MKYLNINSMRAKLDRSTNSIYELIKKDLLPKAVKLNGENIWSEAAVDAAIAKLAAAQGVNWDLPPLPPAPANEGART